jgi:hypothetical protein
MAVKYTKWPQNTPNCLQIDQQLQLRDPPKITQIGIIGLKICHLATLAPSPDNSLLVWNQGDHVRFFCEKIAQNVAQPMFWQH